MTAAPFQREARYIVIKRAHLLTEQSGPLGNTIHDLDITTIDCVVVEKDWPEFEPVWGMIEARVEGYPVPDEQVLEDIIGDAIGDSFDMDWQARDGAKAVIQALKEEGVIVNGAHAATLLAQLKIAKRHLDGMAAFIGKANRGEFSGCYQLEALGEDMPAINAAIGGAA